MSRENRHQPSYREYTRPAPADPGPPPTGTDFPGLMTAYGQASGLGTPHFRGGSASFQVPVDGEEYLVVLSGYPRLVLASACSRITFPGGMPPELRRVAARLNADRPSRCEFEVAENASGANFISTTECPRYDLTLPRFEALVKELMTRIYTLDRVLMRNGYGG